MSSTPMTSPSSATAAGTAGSPSSSSPSTVGSSGATTAAVAGNGGSGVTPSTATSSSTTTTTAVTSTTTSSSLAPSASSTSETYFSLWDLDSTQLDEWVRSVPTLFPQPKTTTSSTTTSTGGDGVKQEEGGGGHNNDNNNSTSADKDKDTKPTTTSSSTTITIPYTPEELKRLELIKVAWSNLQRSLDELQVVVEDLPSSSTSNSKKLNQQKQNEDDDEEDGEPASKRTKLETTTAEVGGGVASNTSAAGTTTTVSRNVHDKQKKKPRKTKKKTTKTTIIDPYNIYVHTIRRHEKDTTTTTEGHDGGDDHHEKEEDEDDEEYAQDIIHATIGGKLSKLSSSGIMNGMSGRLGGVVTTRHGTPVPGLIVSTTPLPTAHNATIKQLKVLASAFCHAIQTRMETDVLITTPIRIQQMLAPEAALSEFKSIRRRVYDTVILGKGMGHQAGVAAEEMDIPTGPATGVHDIEKFKKCKSCGNNDQALFVLDRKNGDVICSNCGTVASESLMHEGSQFRKFEGEADRNHHGDTANPLYSNAHNMGTTLGGIQMTPGAGGSGAGGGGFGSQKRGLETILRNAHAYTELNISQFGKGDRRTRTGYKDKQKKDAFLQMTHCGDALNLHEAVVQRAKEIFAGFRDDRELVQQFKGVVAACLCEAFDQLSSAGRQILKQKLERDDTATKDESELADDEQKSQRAKFTHSSRANRRNELHHAKLAGKGGLLLDFSAMGPQHQQQVGGGGGTGGNGGGDDAKKNGGGGESAEPATPAASSSPSAGLGTVSVVADKVASSWELDDCRSWLLEASRAIAQKWMQDQKNGKVVGAATSSSSTTPTISKGTSQEEMEGRMVEHAITLCDLLEAELKAEQQQLASGTKAKKFRGAVVTPRVQEMGILGIKWQHSHERGSGGKGGVGNSGKKGAITTTANQNSGLKRKATGMGTGSSSSSTASNSPAFRIAGPSRGGGRTAGQILILKTAKSLGNMLKDPIAGIAFHKELRALVGHQAAQKRKEQRTEATRQRLTQMQRKPWLQARAAQQF